MNESVDKLRTLYTKLEEGKINRDNFPTDVEKEVGVKWNAKADKYLENKSAKDSNFTNLVKVRIISILLIITSINLLFFIRNNYTILK